MATSIAPDGTVDQQLVAMKVAAAKASLLWEIQYGLQELAEKAAQERRSNITPGLWQAVAFVRTLLASAEGEKDQLLNQGMADLDDLVGRLQSLTAPTDNR